MISVPKNQRKALLGVRRWRILVFIETPIFTKRLRELLDDDSYAEFQR